MGSAILEFCSDNNYKNNIVRLGVPDQFIEHGSQAEQRSECGFDKIQITKVINELL